MVIAVTNSVSYLRTYQQTTPTSPAKNKRDKIDKKNYTKMAQKGDEKQDTGVVGDRGR